MLIKSFILINFISEHQSNTPLLRNTSTLQTKIENHLQSIFRTLPSMTSMFQMSNFMPNNLICVPNSQYSYSKFISDYLTLFESSGIHTILCKYLYLFQEEVCLLSISKLMPFYTVNDLK